MALPDPNEVVERGSWDPGSKKQGHVEPPDDVKVPGGAEKNTDYYANYVIYADGRRVVTWHRRKTDEIVGETEDKDTAVEKRYKEAVEKETKRAADEKKASQPETVSAPPTQPNIVTRDPNTGALNTTPNPNYVPPAATTGAGTYTRTEGMPDPTKPGGRDNERPVKVTYNAAGQVVGQPVPLEGKELQEWYLDRERSRNPNRMTDKELADQQTLAAGGEVKTPEIVNGKPYIKVTKKVGNTQETYYTDEAGNRVPTPVPEKEKPTPTPQLAPDKKSWGYWDGGQWITIPPEKAPPLPGEPEKPPTEVNGVFGTWKQVDGQWRFVATPDQPGQVKLPEGAPQIDLSSPQAAFDSFQRLTGWVQQQAAGGKLSPAQVKEILATPYTQVSMVLDREKDQNANALTQRSQDTSLQTNALSNATQGMQTATSFGLQVAGKAGPGDHGYNAIMGALALQRMQAQNLGWNPNGVAPVVVNPLVQQGVIPGPVTTRAPYLPGAPVGVPSGGVSATPVGDVVPAQPAAAPPQPVVTAPGQVPLPAPLLRPPPVIPDSPTVIQEAAPQSLAVPGVVPVMAMSRSMTGGGGYEPAISSLTSRGFSSDIIQQAMKEMGIA